MNEYVKLNCPECGEPLEMYYEGPIEEFPGKPWDFVLGDCRYLIRHCSKCRLDWESQWIHMEGFDAIETQLDRKFWG